MKADIAEVVQFLRGFAPEATAKLVGRRPELRVYFEASGLPLGGEGNAAPAIDAVSVMLEAVDEIATAAMTKTLANLKAARRLDLAGSLTTLVASGGVVGTVLGAGSQYVAAVLGAIGFVASAVPIIGNWLRGAAVGDQSVGQSFMKLRELVWDARVLRAEFDRSSTDEECANLFKQANSLAKDIYMVLSDLGYDPKLKPI